MMEKLLNYLKRKQTKVRKENIRQLEKVENEQKITNALFSKDKNKF